MKYLFVTQHKKTWPIDLMCRVLGVSRQGYYHYRRNTEARLADPEHQEMLDWVKDIAIASHYTYGRRRMKKAMNVLGFPITRTMTEIPCLVSSLAADKPAEPAPIIMTSVCVDITPTLINVPN